MHVQDLIQTYGYVVIVLGAFLEGETFLVLGGFLAHQGYLKLPMVMAAAFAGSVLGDHLFFFLGRWRSQAVLARRPKWAKRLKRARSLLERHRIPVILGFRFLYGFRIITPFAIGVSRVPVIEFILLNLLGAALWSVAAGSAGYFFGAAGDTFVTQFKRYELLAVAVIVLAAAVAWAVYLVRSGRENDEP